MRSYRNPECDAIATLFTIQLNPVCDAIATLFTIPPNPECDAIATLFTIPPNPECDAVAPLNAFRSIKPRPVSDNLKTFDIRPVFGTKNLSLHKI